MKTAMDEITSPLTTVARILAMTPTKLNPKNRIVLSIPALIQTAVYLLTVGTLTVIYFAELTQAPTSDFAKAGTIRFLMAFRCLGNTLVMLLIFTFNYNNSKKLHHEAGNIAKIDAALSNLGLDSLLDQANVESKRLGIILLILVDLIMNVLGELGAWTGLVQESNRWIFFIVVLYSRLVISTKNIHLYILFFTIQKRFELINRLLDQHIVQSSRSKKYPIVFDFAENIRHLTCLHKNLTRIAKSVNGIFSVQSLLCITMNFVLLIGDLHTSMYVIFFNLFQKHYRLVFVMLKNCILYLFDLYYLAKRSSDVCHEANRAKVVLLGIRIDMDKEDERNCVIACALKLMQNKLEITACRLFNIDNALLFSICGAASSYLFIMLQLDMGGGGISGHVGNGTSNGTV